MCFLGGCRLNRLCRTKRKLRVPPSLLTSYRIRTGIGSVTALGRSDVRSYFNRLTMSSGGTMTCRPPGQMISVVVVPHSELREPIWDGYARPREVRQPGLYREAKSNFSGEWGKSQPRARDMMIKSSQGHDEHGISMAFTYSQAFFA